MFSRKVFHACAVVNNIYLLRINIENFNDILLVFSLIAIIRLARVITFFYDLL